MTKASEILQLLLDRQPAGPILERYSAMPHDWGEWMRSRPSVDCGLTVEALIWHLHRQPRSPSPSSLRPSVLQAFGQLWWQQWDPAPQDERVLRRLAILVSFLIHALTLIVLVWMALLHWAAPPLESSGEGSMRLSFVSRGSAMTGDQDGSEQLASGERAVAVAGKVVPATAQSVPTASVPVSVAAKTATQVASMPELMSPTARHSEPSAPAADIGSASVRAVTAAPSASVEQPLLTTPTPVATSAFVVAETSVQQMEIPQLQPAMQVSEHEREEQLVHSPIITAKTGAVTAPEVIAKVPAVQEREVQVITERAQFSPPRLDAIALPELAPRQLPIHEHEVPTVIDRPHVSLPVVAADVAPELAAAAGTVREREITPPVRDAVHMVKLQEHEVDVTFEPRELRITPREIPEPNAALSEQAVVEQNTADTSVAPAEPVKPVKPFAKSSPSTVSVLANRGTAIADNSRRAVADADWSAGQSGDDWNLPAQTADGHRDAVGKGVDGLFDGSGTARVPAQNGIANAAEATRGAPGSDADSWSRDRIAQSGTWLKRPPYDYAPTSLEQYWVPNETLLSEWVRKGIKKIKIAIPGTSTKISCVVSLLQFGAGCGLTDPNKNEQPAQARPPPDIPFKKELQENNGSVR